MPQSPPLFITLNLKQDQEQDHAQVEAEEDAAEVKLLVPAQEPVLVLVQPVLPDLQEHAGHQVCMTDNYLCINFVGKTKNSYLHLLIVPQLTLQCTNLMYLYDSEIFT